MHDLPFSRWANPSPPYRAFIRAIRIALSVTAIDANVTHENGDHERYNASDGTCRKQELQAEGKRDVEANKATSRAPHPLLYF